VIRKLKDWFVRLEKPGEEARQPNSVQFCVAVLLAEIARADHEHKEVETDEMRRQLGAEFDLSGEQTRELVEAAQHAVENSVSLHEFTRTLHSEMSYAEKEMVIEMLWRIALADQDLDKYEDYMIGKIAELLYIYRGDVIRLKHRVIESRPQSIQ